MWGIYTYVPQWICICIHTYIHKHACTLWEMDPYMKLRRERGGGNGTNWREVSLVGLNKIYSCMNSQIKFLKVYPLLNFKFVVLEIFS